ncbi:hypothetical protein PF005_g20213 [Phytophthora fragariae]|uniref:Crinkler effector protein N-terminal domain-containing protein n=4 Tax=Phytophthora fragariae TaxID=53985 RepID=A0A6A3XR32_9STRA|nr:hypothetical protein PF003_g21773 [Phytophthora fragariae]KAE8988739.1 hypothetical protein PF011_g19049 [Phytophthora fragariae]KAE9087256.1 hypothetical protein PF007_g20443 [Phytophthora fragariae]KAE9087840.1 hypothetical protein PF010_g19579 [Phytophthora fragariae]KAE9107056.1 hypothetical protein PF006_g21209 [Phytophthora fragariae]
MAPILLNCVVVGEAGMVSVVIEDRSTVFLLKMAIKEASEGIAVPAKKLQLFLAKQDAAWMNSAAAEAVQLDDDGNLTGFEPMDANLWLNHDKHFGTNFTPKEGQIHVLVVVPGIPEDKATVTPTPFPAEQMKMAMTEFFNERDQRLSVYSISTCTLSQEERLKRKLGYTYKTIDVTEDIDGSIGAYTWQENVAESCNDHRAGYMQYLKHNLQDVLHQDGSATKASARLKPKNYLKGTAKTTNLLNCDIPCSRPFRLTGTADMMIIDKAAKDMNEVFAGLQFVIEVKRGHCGAQERCKILLEMVAADLKSERRCAPVGLLTKLNDYWYFLWFTPDKEIARVMLKCPANGFKMMKELLSGTTITRTGVFSMRIQFLRLPPQKRQKLIEAAPADDDAATEMMERYELMSDELSPEFLLARRMEYEFQKVREMPIHSEMSS